MTDSKEQIQFLYKAIRSINREGMNLKFDIPGERIAMLSILENALTNTKEYYSLAENPWVKTPKEIK